jgi:hypothetical protein
MEALGMQNCNEHASKFKSDEHFCGNSYNDQQENAESVSVRKAARRFRHKWFFAVIGLVVIVFAIGAVRYLVFLESYRRNSVPVISNIESIIDDEFSDTYNQTEISAEYFGEIIKPIEMNQIFADFKDGILDNLILIHKGEESELALKASTLNFEKHVIVNDFLSARSVHAVDIDLDGDIDVLGAARYIHRIALWINEGVNLNTGKIIFTEHIIDNEFQGAFSVHGADFDNDGYKDVIGASLYDEQIAWWRNNQDGTFSGRKIIDNYFDGAIFVYCADVDNDGNMDVLAAGEAVDQIAWWRNMGGGKFESRIVIGDDFTGARSVHAADVDRDGDIDVLGTARFADKVAWWENKGDGKEFLEHILDDSFDGPRSVHATDLNDDGDIDVLAAARYSHQIALWDNDGYQNFTKIIIDDLFEGATNVYSTDIDRDGRKDIVAAAVYADKVAWWQNKGEGKFTRHIIGEDFKGATFVFAEDVNGDEYKDILVPAVFDNQIALWINQPQYQSAGAFVSPLIKRIENLKLGNLAWNGLTPENTFLRFQIRSANSIEELEKASWYGPISPDDYYTVSATDINPVHNEHLFLQYRVFFETSNELVNLKLSKVIINYDGIDTVK